MATRYIYQGTFQDLSGNAVSSGTISVYLNGTTTAASVYEESSGGTAVNSVTSDSYGKFLFYVDDGDYNLSQKFKIILSKSGFLSKTYDDIVIYPEQEYTYYANASATDQSVDADDNSIADLLAEIGTTNIRTIVCKQGTYTFSTTVDWSTYTNVTLKIQPGALFAVDTAITVTCGMKIDTPGLQQWISLTGTGVINFSTGALQSVFPQWWGIDGTADNVQISNAVSSLTLGEVVIPPSTYAIAAATTGKTGVNITGLGYPVLQQTANDINIFELSDVTDVTIRGIKFDGNGMGTKDSSSTAIVNRAIFSDDSATKNKNVKIIDNIFTDMYAFGVVFLGPGAAVYSFDATVENNYFYDMPDEGTNFYYMKRSKSVGNIFDNHGKEAIKMSNGYDILIEGNQIYESGTGASQGPLINIGQSMEKVRCIGNHCESGYIGIGIENGGVDVKIIDNTLKGQARKGIGISNSAALETIEDILIQGNTVDADCSGGNYKVEGRYDKKIGRVTVKDNVSKGNATNGNVSYHFTFIDHLVFENNKSIDSKDDGASFGKIDRLNFNRNIIKNARLNGIEATNIKYMMACENEIINPSQVGASTYDAMQCGSDEVWSASSTYARGDSVIPSSTNRTTYYYECATSGGSCAAEPTWGTVVGSNTTEGPTLEWTCRRMVLRAENNTISDSNSFARYGIASYATVNNFGFNYVSGVSGTPIRQINSTMQLARSEYDFTQATLQRTGGFETGIVAKTGSYTMAGTDHTAIVSPSSDMTITLPLSSNASKGRIYTVLKASGSTASVILNPSSDHTINGATSRLLSTQWTYLSMQANGEGAYYIVGGST